jgi:hypothetical protein
MRIYVVMVADRHADPVPYLFTDPDVAVAYARQWAREHSLDGEIEEDDIDGWLYYATYSVESDSVWVLAKDVDARP